MATTTNYGWTTPDDTALVKDGAAAIRTLGSSVDTTTKALNPETTLGDIAYRSSTANVNTRLPLGTAGQVLKVNSGATAPEWATDASGMTNPMTTTGDTIYSSSGSTPARLAIGSTGNVLTVAGGVPTWAAPAGGGSNFTLLNSGGTALTGAQTITISGISGADKIMVLFQNASSANAASYASLQLNTDTGANYGYFGSEYGIKATWNAASFAPINSTTATQFFLASMGNAVTDSMSGYAMITGANSAGIKMIQGSGIGNGGGDNNGYNLGGFYSGSSTISSISLRSSTGNWDNGTVYVYTSA
jgi:hypothetical protein